MNNNLYLRRQIMRTRNKAFTLVELLTVIGIISLLLSLALPALNEARVRAREVGDRASLHSVGVAVESFANDMGYYPESGLRTDPDRQTLEMMMGDQGEAPADQGAHRLVESLVGLDYLGFERHNYYQVADGIAGIDDGTPIFAGREAKRWGPYVQLESIAIGTMQEAHPDSHWFAGVPDPEDDPISNPNPVFVGTLDRNAPKAILYYRARASKHLLDDIYDWLDNEYITKDEDATRHDLFHPNFSDPAALEGFYRFIWDTRTGMGVTENDRFDSPSARPFNKDTFILINAGRDHEYGTADDICNFQKR
jgi:prepilin-type N-terminal cleavage/methylation domain-containing protein